jgi:predicted Zn-dependent protease
VPADSLNRSIVNRDPYLKVIDGIVFGENPRQGFFEGSRFNHPDLRFRLDFPAGWKTQNTAEAVLAGSPASDAIMQLTLGGQDTPQALLQKFGQQQGIQMTADQRVTVNGSAAATAEFQAQDQQSGALAGRVMYLSYGGTTYQLLGYSTAQKYGSYASAIYQTMQSFAQLTDQAALARQPVHLSLVRLPRGMSITEFYREYPSTVKIELIAAINGVEGNGVLPAGTWAKRVQ